MIRMVPNWRAAWRWSSVRLIALAAAVKLAFLGWPELAGLLPPWVTQGAAVLALLGLLLGARLTTTETADAAQRSRD